MSLYAPFRALGYVCSERAFALQTRGQDHFVTTVVGSAYHVYNCKKLNLVFVGMQDADIAHVSCSGKLTFVACGNEVRACMRDVTVRRYTGHTAAVSQVLPFGSHLVVLAADNTIRIFEIDSGDIFAVMEDFSAANFLVTALLHPSTYLNKILLGSKGGSLQLWNIRTQKLLYTFPGWKSGVTALAQAPALDVVAVATESGKVILHNIREDVELLSFLHEGGPVTALAFRTDGEPIMATANTLGAVALWDLEQRRLHSIISDCHETSVASIAFLRSQPLMITSSNDNTLKIWIFDQADGSARLLRSRSGHSAPPNRIRFYGHSNDLLSTGHDRSLRSVSVTRDERGTELSQGSTQHKARVQRRSLEDVRLPPVVALAAEPTREKDWANIVTCHRGRSDAYTWSYENKTLTKLTLSLPEAKAARISATTAAISACGNFALVGYSSGATVKFNVQSGLLRTTFGGEGGAHTGTVTAAATDALNAMCATGSSDKTVKLWNFASGKLKSTVKLKASVAQLELHRGNNLLAIASADYIVRLFDMETRRIVRVFQGHEGRLTDMTWSPDGRWIVTASMDGTIRTWDVPSGRLLHWFAVAEAATSVSFSPRGEFLATTHVDNLGIFLWSNRSFFADLNFKPIHEGDKPELIKLPVVGDEGPPAAEVPAAQAEPAAAAAAGDPEAPAADAALKSAEQLDAELITLSTLPKSRWLNLSKLDVIRRRNKPTEPPKAPALAPFFLATVPGLVTSFRPEEDPLGAAARDSTESRIVNFGKLGVLSAFQRCLLSCCQQGAYTPLLTMLKGMGLAAVDVEIRQLTATNEGEQLRCMLEFCATVLESRCDYELGLAYLDLFLQVHGEQLVQFPQLLPCLQRISVAHHGAWTQLDGLFQHALCLINFFRSSVLP